MKKILFKSFLLWLPFAALISFVCLLSYVLVQQNFRQTANDPQVQIAEDIAQAIGTGVSPQEIVSPGVQTVDIATSLDPYVIIFNASGTILASSATLHGQPPTLPQGVSASVIQHGGEDRFTWQPAPGVRSAVVVDHVAASGNSPESFVLAGRSIREIEIREENTAHIAGLGWIAGLVVMFGIILFMAKIEKRFKD
jgi:hypothetical protein